MSTDSLVLQDTQRTLSNIYHDTTNSGENIMGRGSPGPTVGGGALRPTGAVAQGSPRQESEVNVQDHGTSEDESNTSEHATAAKGNSVSFHAGGALRPTGVGGKGSSGPTLISGALCPTDGVAQRSSVKVKSSSPVVVSGALCATDNAAAPCSHRRNSTQYSDKIERMFNANVSGMYSRTGQTASHFGRDTALVHNFVSQSSSSKQSRPSRRFRFCCLLFFFRLWCMGLITSWHHS